MRKMPSDIRAMLVIGAVMAALLAGPAAAFIDNLPVGGHDRGGRENLALFGTDLSGDYERGDYELSALLGSDLSGDVERGDYRFDALAGYDLDGTVERGDYRFS